MSKLHIMASHIKISNLIYVVCGNLFFELYENISIVTETETETKDTISTTKIVDSSATMNIWALLTSCPSLWIYLYANGSRLGQFR